MLQIRRDDGVWVQFYVIKYYDLAGEGDTFDTRSLAEQDAKVYGKYVGGVAGYTPWWVYLTVPKSKLREV